MREKIDRASPRRRNAWSTATATPATRSMIITATNDFVTAPIAARRYSTPDRDRAERDGERYTGRVAGTPSFRQGKVERLREWLRDNDGDLGGAWFYSDSHNDLPLLRWSRTRSWSTRTKSSGSRRARAAGQSISLLDGRPTSMTTATP